MKKGRLRNQGFINFHSEESAEEILKTLNGYFINEKPLIIVYFFFLSLKEIVRFIPNRRRMNDP